MRTHLLITTTLALFVATASAGEPTHKNPAPAAQNRVNPLSFADGRLVFDIEERMRIEGRGDNFDFNSGADAPSDGAFLLQRARFGVKYSPLPWLSFYGQAQSALEFGGRGGVPGVNGAEGDDPIDLQQAFLRIGGGEVSPFSAQIGRQAFSYGDQRLAGAFDWNNFGRVFDAARLRYEQGDFWIEAFAGSVVVVERNGFNTSDLLDEDDRGREQLFAGFYASTKSIPSHTLDLYAFWLDQQKGNVANVESALAVPPAGSQGGNPAEGMAFATLGVRINNDPKKMGGLEYDAELAAQLGGMAGLDFAAFAGHAGAGYNFDHPWSPRLYAQYNYATGDNDPADGRSGTFQNLFPTNHKFYGYMDLFSWQNLQSPGLSFSVKPKKSLTLAADYHLFWLATTDDYWYRANGLTRVRPLTPEAAPFVGSEFDLSFTWCATDSLSIHGGFAHFFAGDYPRDTGASSDADFVYLQAELKF